jgi:hypothetical protein
MLVMTALAILGVGVGAVAGEWYRGNTHAHTDRSDGNAPPEAVVAQYRDLGYHFVVLSDHDRLTLVSKVEHPGEFLVIPGEEVSASHEARPLHLTAVGLSSTVTPKSEGTVAEIIEENAEAIRQAGGLPILNHPNLGWFLTDEHILETREIRHFELVNPHPVNNAAGGGGSPSIEEMWDRVLSHGHLLYGVAADDAHDYESFAPFASPRGPAPRANPGLAWIMVKASELTTASILEALAAGNFYATTGVELLSYESDAEGIRLTLPKSYRYTVEVPGELRYRTYFIGEGGRVLTLDESLTPEYVFEGTELYVRARVEASDGTKAWTQPVFPGVRR